MPPKLFLLTAILTLFSANNGWADAPIKEMGEVQLNVAAFAPNGAENPLLIQSVDEATPYFDAKNLATLKKQVDFSKQEVLVFAWRGSGQDLLDYVVLESFPEKIRFRYQRGRTRDLRQHVKVFIVRSNVKCIVNDKIVSNVEVKEDGRWEPTKLPLAGLVEGKAVTVRVRGTLTHGIIAIGGETTGTTIRFGETTWELDLRKAKMFSSAAEKLSGKRVVVSGLVRTQKGVEIGTRTILAVGSIESVQQKAVPKNDVPVRIMGKPFLK